MAKKNLVPLVSIMVVRGGKRVSPPIGKAYPFEEDELKVLKEGRDYRLAVNEDQEASEAEVKGERNSVGFTPKTNAAGAGNSTAMANGADGSQRTEQRQTEERDTRLDGNVTEIKTLIADIVDKADLAALKAAEEAGQNRSGVTTAIDARVAALTTDDDL
jgi:hypothetical protein